MKWIALVLTMIVLAACTHNHRPPCQVALPPGTGPQGCFSAEDLRSLCRAAMECSGGVVANGVAFGSCPGGPNVFEVLAELRSGPGKECRNLLR